MIKGNRVILYVFLAIVVLSGSCKMTAKKQHSDIAIDELVVAFKKDISISYAEQILFIYGLSYYKTDDVNLGKAFFYKNNGRTYRVKVPSGKVKYWIQKLEAERSISSVDYYQDIFSAGFID